MKKYLMTGIAALALGGIITSCSHDMDQYKGGNTTENIKKTYENAFIETFGPVANTQTWGFGSATVAGTRGGTRANPGETYPQTETGVNANANEWADPNKEFGGWVVPDPLTEGQKLRAQKYFQANPNLSYEDPHFRHFFVQQVYKGATDPGANSTEVVTAAGGSTYTSGNMNHLTVGFNEQHINNFNAGTCSTSKVLSNDGNVNDGPYHSDEIMLMVNIDDTKCFGYHDTGSSNQSSDNPNHNDKMALVSAATIDAWAASNGNPGEAVVDKWNRSFMGFDLAIKEDEQAHSGDFAPFSDVPGNTPQYVWDGTNILKKGKAANARKSMTRRAGTRGETSVDLWSGTEQRSNNNGLSTSFSNDAKKMLVAGNYLGIDLTVETEWQWGTYNDWRLKIVGGYYNPAIGDGEITLNASSTNVEIQLTENDINTISTQGYTLIAIAVNNPINFSRIYIRGTEKAESDNDNNDNNDNTGNNDNTDNSGNTGDNTQNQEESYELYGEDTYIIINGEKIPYLSTNMNMYVGETRSLNDGDMKVNKDGKECLNLPAFKELVDAGYLPVKDKNLRTWVKLGKSDGYFSDWIVTLTEAKRISSGDGGDGGDDDDENGEIEKVRIIAEDLTLSDYGKDFDFNDAVFDVIWNKTKGTVSIKVLAAGGELTMYIGGTAAGVDSVKTVNELFKEANPDKNITEKTMINTAPGRHTEYKSFKLPLEKDWWSGNTIEQIAKSIYIRVMKSGELITLSADQGKAASKIAVGTDYEWCDEREDVDDKFGGKFSEYVGGAHSWDTWYK